MHTFKSFVLLTFGLTLAVVGCVQSIQTFPPASVFDRLVTSLPTIGAVLVFAVASVVSVAGFVLLIIGVRAFRQRSLMRVPVPQQRPQQHFHPSSYDPSEFEPRRHGRLSMNGGGDTEEEYGWAGTYR